LYGLFTSSLGSRNVHLIKALVPLIALSFDHQNHSKWHKWCHVRYNYLSPSPIGSMAAPPVILIRHRVSMGSLPGRSSKGYPPLPPSLTNSLLCIIGSDGPFLLRCRLCCCLECADASAGAALGAAGCDSTEEKALLKTHSAPPSSPTG